MSQVIECKGKKGQDDQVARAGGSCGRSGHQRKLRGAVQSQQMQLSDDHCLLENVSLLQVQ